MASDPTTGMSLDFSGSPNASVYAEQAAGAQKAYNDALTNIAAKRSQLYNQTGFKVENNTDGTIKNYAVDGLNATGQYQQLQKSEGMGLEAQHAADMARNIGMKGIGAQNTSNLRYADGVAQANFGNNFLTANQGLVDEQANAKGSLMNMLMQLQLQAIADARNSTSPMPNEGGDPGGDGGTGGGKPSPTQTTAQDTAGGILPGAKTIPKATQALIAAAAMKAGQPISEHGMGQMTVVKPPTTAKKALLNAYVTGQKKTG